MERLYLTDHVRPRELRLQGLVVGSDEKEGHVEVVVELPGLVLRRLKVMGEVVRCLERVSPCLSDSC